MQNSIDIIIPVFNGYDDLIKCVDSVKKHTDFNKHRLIIIDDKSTDGRIKEYLDSLQYENCIVIYNEKNEGFSASVNKGMLSSEENDVLLLNSDTIVTKNWLEKIQRAAYSAGEIGTVTPLSNAATLASYPVFLKDNEIPRGYTIDSLAELIECVSIRAYPKVTVAVGFCMYIKREVIDLAGVFDAETFQRGYGEENDFCNRIIQLGYTNILCDDTFIYHRGTGSFETAEKETLKLEHDRILREKYYGLMQENDEYCRINPNQYIINNINIYSEIFKYNKTEKTILFILHSDFLPCSDLPPGGTQFHVMDMVEYLGEEYNIVVAARLNNMLNVTLYAGEQEHNFRFYIGKNPEYFSPKNNRIVKVWEEIITAFSVDIVHVHHTLRTSLDIFFVAKKLNVPIICSLHDGFMACPQESFFNSEDEFCNNENKSDICNICLHDKNKISGNLQYVEAFRQNMYNALNNCDRIISPSYYIKDTYIKYYPKLNDKINVILHGTKIRKNTKSGNIYKDNKRIRVAFLGTLSKHKGSQEAHRLIKRYKEIDWFSFGVVVDDELGQNKCENYFPCGGYNRDDINDILLENNIDIVCILSKVPESFCYTLSEALTAKIPVIATDIGALGERLRNKGFTWLVSYRNIYNETCEVIDKILCDIDILRKKQNAIRDYNVKSIEEMVNEYKDIYSRFPIKEHIPQKADYKFIFSNYEDEEYKKVVYNFGTRYDEICGTIHEMIMVSPNGRQYLDSYKRNVLENHVEKLQETVVVIQNSVAELRNSVAEMNNNINDSFSNISRVEEVLLHRIENIESNIHTFKRCIKNPFYGMYLFLKLIKRKLVGIFHK